jgi:hypothetical protein
MSNGGDLPDLNVPELEKILSELLSQEKPKVVLLPCGLYLKYESAVNFYPHKLTIFRKGVYPHDGKEMRRNYPSHKEGEIVLKHFFKAMHKLNRKITGRIPKSQEDEAKQNEAGEWFYAKSWVWNELVQGRLPLGDSGQGKSNNYQQ